MAHPDPINPKSVESIDDHRLEVQRLFVAHQERLKSFVFSLEPDHAQVDDIIQESFLVVSRRAADFEIGTNFQAWTRTIARFTILSFRKRRQRSPLQLDDDVLEALAASAPEPDDDDTHRLKTAALKCCLGKLAPRTRELIRLRYFGEHGPDEIAARLGQTVNSVNVALSQGRSLLRRCVERAITSNPAL